PVSLLLFMLLPSRTAAFASYVACWLILPTVSYNLPGLPDYSKATAASYGVLLGTLFFDPARLLSFRPRWFDLPIFAFILCGTISSLTNDLGIYDGLSNLFVRLVIWGVPYVMGRIYVRDADDARAFALAIFIGGLCYVPPCLFEIRMSPQIGRHIY